MKSTALACLFLLSLQSCFLARTGVNEPIDPAVVRSIKPGTSAKEVVAKMGAPDEVVQLGRRTAYRYSHVVEKGTGSYWVILGLYNEDSRRDMAWFFFDENESLTHMGSTFQSHRASFHALPWTDVYDAEDTAADDTARFGK
jgi:hypothetical protein